MNARDADKFLFEQDLREAGLRAAQQKRELSRLSQEYQRLVEQAPDSLTEAQLKRSMALPFAFSMPWGSDIHAALVDAFKDTNWVHPRTPTRRSLILLLT